MPPYISPYPRYLAGAVKAAGHDFFYTTADAVRAANYDCPRIRRSNLLAIIGGAIVPGKYLRSMPLSINEIKLLAQNYDCKKVLGGPIARFRISGREDIKRIEHLFDKIAKFDVEATVYDYLKYGEFTDRYRTLSETSAWSKKGAVVVKTHPDFPQSLIAEIETYRGCVRYFTGGCSFCTEPLIGEPVFRNEEDIITEIQLLYDIGVRNFRIGAQSCIFCYKVLERNVEKPTPNVEALRKLFQGIRRVAPNLNVLHVDNANPAVIAAHPEEARKVAKILVEHCTSGNVLAFGMESADPVVIKSNNLNCSPEEVFAAVKLINEIGAERGESGLPSLLPGVNILCGLHGERKETYELNFQFLKTILDANLLLRRINIRQVASVRQKFNLKYHNLFMKFKKKVRAEIDAAMLAKLVPCGTVLKNVYLETTIGNFTYGRQIGSYPLLVVFPYKTKLQRFVDAKIVSTGQRSVTGVEYPMEINSASLDALLSLPGIGKKRAAKIILSRPFKKMDDFLAVLDDEKIAQRVAEFVKISTTA